MAPADEASGLAARDFASAPLPPPDGADHVTGPASAPLVIEYGDYECPYCAVVEVHLSVLSAHRVFRHFPVRTSHPRAWAAACAAEAAARQGRFWEMHASLLGDQGRLEDPHLWDRARSLGLDLEQFDADRRSDEVGARVRRDFESGIRAGVVGTPTLFVASEKHVGRLDRPTLERLVTRGL